MKTNHHPHFHPQMWIYLFFGYVKWKMLGVEISLYPPVLCFSPVCTVLSVTGCPWVAAMSILCPENAASECSLLPNSIYSSVFFHYSSEQVNTLILHLLEISVYFTQIVHKTRILSLPLSYLPAVPLVLSRNNFLKIVFWI